MMQKLRSLSAIAALWLALASPVLASQATLVTPSAPLPMTSLAAFLNSAFLSIGSCNSGNSAPANGTGGLAFAGECWINTTGNPWIFSYTSDGTHWSEFGRLNTSTFVWTGMVPTGGTGNNSFTAHCVVLGQGTSALGCLNGSSGNSSLPLISQGAGADPIYSVLPVAALPVLSSGVTLGGTTMGLGSDATGDIYYNSGGVLTRLPKGTNGNVLEMVSGLPAWASVSGTGTVTSVTCGPGLSGGTFTSSGTCAVSLSKVINSLSGNVTLNNTSTFFDGPTVAQGASGTWFASGTVTLQDNSAAATFFCKLWDGTNVIASGAHTSTASSKPITLSLSGYSVSAPPGNIRMSCEDITSTAGFMLFAGTGFSMDSTVTAIRIQ